MNKDMSAMPNLPLLLPAQKSLIIDLVEAAERVSPEERTDFTVIRLRGDDGEKLHLSHPGIETITPGVVFSDFQVLAHNNLLLLDGERSYRITLLPEAYVVYGSIKQPILPEARAAVREVLATTLTNAQRALRVLELRAARYGETHIPSDVARDLEDKKVEIADLEKHIQMLDSKNDTNDL
jgi:hypothetical protein